jgi:hypothetical protein
MRKPRGTIASKHNRRAENGCRRFDVVMDYSLPIKKIQEPEKFIWSAELLATDGEISIAGGLSL